MYVKMRDGVSNLHLSFTSKVLTRDSVTVSVDAVVYYRVSNATVSVANVENAHHSTRLLAQTTLRNILGELKSGGRPVSEGGQRLLINNWPSFTQTLAFTLTLMVVFLLGTKSLHEILSDRESISNAMQVGLNTVAASSTFAFLIKWDSGELRPK